MEKVAVTLDDCICTPDTRDVPWCPDDECPVHGRRQDDYRLVDVRDDA